ncbi:phytanoyl-CoA dioxygenase family protein [Pseudomonas cucumis]|uniref:Phytanoyl-CoA dioxygenase family protein n=1 Tax=Pseudomonas cucumis TaxID=2954082 RepID=A0ABY9EZB5_9PSED|nr:phytanoyl-CoA dioxygenase family protein [Pseudomonas cucumis]WLG85675.1 phytanoyl-CoA dioxygenase family protein [Pseudomonas cucumis]
MSYLNKDLALSKQEYWQKGYTVLPGLFDAKQIEYMRQECGRLWRLPSLGDDLNLRTEFRRGPDNDYVLDRLDPVIDMSSILAGAAMYSPLLEAVDTLLGGESELLKCKLIRKDPGTKGYAVHQDFLYWKWLDIKPDQLCSVAINLFDSGENSGGIAFYPAQHQALIPGPAGNETGDCDIARIDTSVTEVPLLAAGDVIIFHSLTPHFSGPNLSDRSRTILLPSYCLTDKPGLYEKYYTREIIRRCEDMIGFERYLAQLSGFQRALLSRETVLIQSE